MAKVEVKFGELGLVIEGEEKNLPAYLETMMKVLVKEFPSVLGEAPKKPVKTGARTKPKKTVKGSSIRRGPKSKPVPKPKLTQGSFGKHLTGYKKKISDPREILVFADWFGKKFKSKDYYAAIEEANIYTDSKRTNFFNRLSSLKKSNNIKKLPKGFYSLTDKGKETVAKLK